MKINSLQSLRFIFFILIFSSHLSFLSEFNEYRYIYVNFLKYGYVGTTFFIILSGFFSVLAFKNNINRNKKRISKFYLIHVITLLISLPLTEFKFNFYNIFKFLSNLFLFTVLIPNQNFYFSYNEVSWFISLVVFLGFLTPLIIQFIDFLNNNISRIILSICIIYFLQLFISTIFINSNFAHYLIYISPYFRIFDFILGGLGAKLYLILLNRNIKINFIIEIVLFIITILVFKNISNIPYVYTFDSYLSMYFVLLIIVISLSKNHLNSFLSNKFLVYLGDMTLYLFMTHLLVIQYMTIFISKFNLHIPIMLVIIIILLITYFVSLIIKKINLFFISWLNKKYLY